MPSARASASQFSKGAGPPAGCVPNPPCHTQSSTTHRPVYRPQDEEFERYDDDISIAVPHAARPAPSLLGSPSPHIPLSLAPQGAVELYQPRTSDGHAPQAAHEHNLSDGITAPHRAASRPDSLLTLAGPPTSDRAPCFEEPSTAGPGPGPKHALHAHSPLAQPPPLRRGEWNRMIQAASLPPSARMDADNHRVPGAHQRITSREANARSTSCEAHTSWTRRASHAIPTATVTTPGRCLPSDFEDASSLVPAEERPEHSGPQRSMLEKRPKPGPSQPVSGTKPARAKRERPQGNRVEPRPRQRKRTKKGTARAEADKAKEPSCKAKAHVGRPERIACEDPEAGGSGGVLAMEVSPARMPIRLQRSPAPSTTPLACDPGLTGSTEVDAACLQAERNAPSSKYFKRFPADQTETPDLSLPAHAPGNSPEYAGGGVGDDAPLFGEQHRACPTQNTGARAEVPFGIAALRGAGPSDEDESPHGNPARQSESYDDNLSRKNAAEPEEDEQTRAGSPASDYALSTKSTAVKSPGI